MPITIKSTGMKYKNPDTGVYQGVDMLEEATIRDVIVDVYSPTLPYAVGEYCLYNGELYCCTTAIPSGGETWNSAHWDKTNVTDELEDIKGAVIDLGSDDVANESNVTGATVSDALDNLSGAINSNATALVNTQNSLAKNIISTVATETLKKGDFRFNRTDGRLWRITDTIQAGESIICGGNAQSLTIGTIFEGFFTINAVIEVNSGYGTVSDGRILSSSAIIIQQRQENGGDGAVTGAKTYIYTGQCTNGTAYIYVRNPDGTNPTNGTKIFVSILISNFN